MGDRPRWLPFRRIGQFTGCVCRGQHRVEQRYKQVRIERNNKEYSVRSGIAVTTC